MASESYPLHWPTGRPRTLALDRRRNWSFSKTRTLAQARDRLLGELRLMGASGVVISSNLKLRADGLPLGKQAVPHDPGVAVYFTLEKGERVALCCDAWDIVEQNVWAVALYVEATRAMLRNGVGSLERAFAGYAALPAPEHREPWHVRLGVGPSATVEEINAAYRERAMLCHPDRGGTAQQMADLNAARDEGFKQRRAA